MSGNRTTQNMEILMRKLRTASSERALLLRRWRSCLSKGQCALPRFRILGISSTIASMIHSLCQRISTGIWERKKTLKVRMDTRQSPMVFRIYACRQDRPRTPKMPMDNSSTCMRSTRPTLQVNKASCASRKGALWLRRAAQLRKAWSSNLATCTYHQSVNKS